MEKSEAIKAVIAYEIEQGQEVYEMLQDGYSGDVEAYIADYAGDYTAEEREDGTIVVNHISGGRPWIVEDGRIERDW